ncbi:Oidioi.mRNA.OKI2018_I69.XSR.g13735.t1.cds [Oikopleura dioica]|uniref:Oidioi.mRNA.OKI2018_I69.XSR.g13735.t1.cds n=1 Tax=Oikopleura dioica TaxID=34765 RepID=A0ABN7SBH2_OIKDI|nr:Oidioi.mRNA.OKI2018_I69.XSR.g13735.t1.cds [Oikopleura dioica]
MHTHDSVQRCVYKDLIALLEDGCMMTEKEKRAKLEPCYRGDRLVAETEACNGTHFCEVREWRDRPLKIWRSALPIGRHARGGLLVKEVRFGENSEAFRVDMGFANIAAQKVIATTDWDYLDAHYIYRKIQNTDNFREADGVHWNQLAHRWLTFIFLQRVCKLWRYKIESSPEELAKMFQDVANRACTERPKHRGEKRKDRSPSVDRKKRRSESNSRGNHHDGRGGNHHNRPVHHHRDSTPNHGDWKQTYQPPSSGWVPTPVQTNRHNPFQQLPQSNPFQQRPQSHGWGPVHPPRPHLPPPGPPPRYEPPPRQHVPPPRLQYHPPGPFRPILTPPPPPNSQSYNRYGEF